MEGHHAAGVATELVAGACRAQDLGKTQPSPRRPPACVAEGWPDAPTSGTPSSLDVRRQGPAAPGLQRPPSGGIPGLDSPFGAGPGG